MFVGTKVIVCWASPAKSGRSVVLIKAGGVLVYSPEFERRWVIGSLFPGVIPKVF